MAEAIFGLIGVIIGGLLQSGAAWRMQRRHEDWAARKAARLFAPSLNRCGIFLMQAAEGATWGEVCSVVSSNLERWPEHAEVFAGTLRNETWHDLYMNVRPLERLVWSASNLSHDRDLPDDALKWMAELSDNAFHGSMACTAIAWRGIQRRSIRSAIVDLRNRLWPVDEEKLMREILGDDYHPTP